MMRLRSPADPVVDQVPVELAEHAVVLRRSATEVQVGLDPRRALVFADGYRRCSTGSRARRRRPA